MNNFNPNQPYPTPVYQPIYAQMTNQPFVYQQTQDQYYASTMATNSLPPPTTYIYDYPPTQQVTYQQEYPTPHNYQHNLTSPQLYVEMKQYSEETPSYENYNRDARHEEYNRSASRYDEHRKETGRHKEYKKDIHTHEEYRKDATKHEEHIKDTDNLQQDQANKKPLVAKLGDLKSAIELSKKTQSMLAKLGFFSSSKSAEATELTTNDSKNFTDLKKELLYDKPDNELRHNDDFRSQTQRHDDIVKEHEYDNKAYNVKEINKPKDFKDEPSSYSNPIVEKKAPLFERVYEDSSDNLNKNMASYDRAPVVDKKRQEIFERIYDPSFREMQNTMPSGNNFKDDYTKSDRSLNYNEHHQKDLDVDKLSRGQRQKSPDVFDRIYEDSSINKISPNVKKNDNKISEHYETIFDKLLQKEAQNINYNKDFKNKNISEHFDHIVDRPESTYAHKIDSGYGARDSFNEKKTHRFDRIYDPSLLRDSQKYSDVDHNVSEKKMMDNYDRFYADQHPRERDVQKLREPDKKSAERFERILLDRYDPPPGIFSKNLAREGRPEYYDNKYDYNKSPNNTRRMPSEYFEDRNYYESYDCNDPYNRGHKSNKKPPEQYTRNYDENFTFKELNAEKPHNRELNIDKNEPIAIEKRYNESIKDHSQQFPSSLYKGKNEDKLSSHNFDRPHIEDREKENKEKEFFYRDYKNELSRSSQKLVDRQIEDSPMSPVRETSFSSIDKRISALDPLLQESALQKINKIYDLIKMGALQKDSNTSAKDDSKVEENRISEDKRIPVLTSKIRESDEFSAHLNILLKSIGLENLPFVRNEIKKSEQQQLQCDRQQDKEREMEQIRTREKFKEQEIAREKEFQKERQQKEFEKGNKAQTGVVIDYSHGPSEDNTKTVIFEKERHLNKLSKTAINVAPKQNLGKMLAANLSGMSVPKRNSPAVKATNPESAFAEDSDLKDIKIKVFRNDIKEVIKEDTSDIWKAAVNAAISPDVKTDTKVVRRIEVFKRSRSPSIERTKQKNFKNINMGKNQKFESHPKKKRNVSRSRSISKEIIKKKERKKSRNKSSSSSNRSNDKSFIHKRQDVKNKWKNDRPVFMNKLNNQKCFKNQTWNKKDNNSFNKKNKTNVQDSNTQKFDRKFSASPDAKKLKPENDDDDDIWPMKTKVKFLNSELKNLQNRKLDVETKPYLKETIKKKVIQHINEQIHDAERDISKLNQEISAKEKKNQTTGPKKKVSNLMQIEIKPPVRGTKIMEPTLKDFKNEPEIVRLTDTGKSKAKKMEFDYFDGGSHWCNLCNVIGETFNDYYNHLHSDHHYKLSEFKRAHISSSKQTTKKQKDAIILPMKGVEFLISTKSIYCELCKELFIDKQSAYDHTISDEHNKKYLDYTVENHNYEKQQQLAKDLKISFAQTYSKWIEPNEEIKKESETIKGKDVVEEKVAIKDTIAKNSNSIKESVKDNLKLPFIGKFPKYKSKLMNKEENNETSISGIVIAAGCAQADNDVGSIDSSIVTKEINSNKINEIKFLDIELPVVKPQPISVKVERITGVVKKKKTDVKVAEKPKKKELSIQEIANEMDKSNSSLTQIASNYANQMPPIPCFNNIGSSTCLPSGLQPWQNIPRYNFQQRYPYQMFSPMNVIPIQPTKPPPPPPTVSLEQAYSKDSNFVTSEVESNKKNITNCQVSMEQEMEIDKNHKMEGQLKPQIEEIAAKTKVDSVDQVKLVNMDISDDEYETDHISVLKQIDNSKEIIEPLKASLSCENSDSMTGNFIETEIVTASLIGNEVILQQKESELVKLSTNEIADKTNIDKLQNLNSDIDIQENITNELNNTELAIKNDVDEVKILMLRNEFSRIRSDENEKNSMDKVQFIQENIIERIDNDEASDIKNDKIIDNLIDSQSIENSNKNTNDVVHLPEIPIELNENEDIGNNISKNKSVNILTHQNTDSSEVTIGDELTKKIDLSFNEIINDLVTGSDEDSKVIVENNIENSISNEVLVIARDKVMNTNNSIKFGKCDDNVVDSTISDNIEEHEITNSSCIEKIEDIKSILCEDNTMIAKENNSVCFNSKSSQLIDFATDKELIKKTPFETETKFVEEIKYEIPSVELNQNLDSINIGSLAYNLKKEKSTDCDSALIPLLCVHG